MSKKPEFYDVSLMRDYMERSRDIVLIARQLHVENPDLSVMTCVGVVLGALRDANSDAEREATDNVAEAIDWVRKAVT